ncbi:SDR family NAD(P)-dependent oxidoreductase [Burkholderia sp. L27(2015)]|uniref:SDR family NAD(P)-dependent oxidoreductase n=1 Tax=Burkholderia sp. L27(2015) TaxID=1641858 RepID=UPI001C2082EC|nr:SDR family NAD(P)-dependent oxidoreductase [Burkholderia sp. L27(2015)]
MKTIVMTGGTSGLGEVAARQIARTPGMRLVLGARRAGQSTIETLPLDLTRLASVREFAQGVIQGLGDSLINGLVLNAGTQFPNLDQRTEDGFETTFAVNHLAHYLLLQLLLPKLAQGATVVITTSDTHDPKQNPMAPKELDPQLLAHPQAQSRPTGFSAGFRAYAASKLCDLLMARGLATSDEAKAMRFTVVAYNPGLTVGTSLFRAWPLWARLAMGTVGLIRPMVRLATVEQAGQNLADLALGRITPPAGRLYASLVKRQLTWPDPSELARQDDVMKGLWRDSARMVGLSSPV